MSEQETIHQFRLRARDWLASHAPATIPSRKDPEYLRVAREFRRAMFEAGFAGIDWPVAFGGQGRTAAERRAFEEEASNHILPLVVFDIGLGMCAPTILSVGTDEQKRRFIRPMLDGSEIWCQLFSEPAAGSDVASLLTRAVVDGDHFIVNGQKVWTTGAEVSDWGMILVRTNPDVPKHRGLTMLVVDMQAPGVTVQPLVDMTGVAHFNEVFFDDVHVPLDAVVGEVDRGWDTARVLLTHERLAVTSGGGTAGGSSGPLSFAGLKAAAESSGILAEPSAQQALVDFYLLEQSLRLFNDRITRDVLRGVDPGARGSVGKLLQGELLLRGGVLAAELDNGDVVAGDAADELAADVLFTPALAIGGGTNEIQLSIIAERLLGLPREPASDTKLPFRTKPTTKEGAA
ncbi:acyl-CoA dehydrogenase family protein [Rhodococcus sp. T7]|uniref:acyl-CoA dehydrogenase family protein n=1 Tax=Rhodococcus sp. T7 TaxID=627444 RepID=UPI00135895D5|nr:acyl-CoA dehydrogenase family protein [Rhodococcus sp. T7]KAF0957132.1 putative acyl-CoA dehydrogenase FadE17 [Rhodococcus sp. T7]KAF0958857.1 putative acyl-CoA dehydrogenase FadE17 [Rhodococcus sp. T7]